MTNPLNYFIEDASVEGLSPFIYSNKCVMSEMIQSLLNFVLHLF